MSSKQKLKQQLIQQHLVEQANERTENMENLLDYTLKSFTLRCKSLLDRIPPHVRQMSMKSFLNTYGASGLQKCLRMEEGGMGERRRTVMQAVREVRRNTQAVKRMHDEMSSESESERYSKKTRRSTRQSEVRESMGYQFSSLLPKTPHIKSKRTEDRSEDAPFVGVNLFSQPNAKDVPQFNFDPSSLLATNSTLDPKRKKEVEQHVKKMQEEFARLKKVLEAPSKPNLSTVKAKVDTGRKKQ